MTKYAPLIYYISPDFDISCKDISSLGLSSTVSISSGTKSDIWASHSYIIYFFSSSSGSSIIVLSSVISSISIADISLSSSLRFLLYLVASTLLLLYIEKNIITNDMLNNLKVIFSLLTKI